VSSLVEPISKPIELKLPKIYKSSLILSLTEADGVIQLLQSEGFAMATEAYCVKCKAKSEMVDGKEVKMKAKGGGTRPAMKGKCKKCGTTMFKIMAKK